MEDLRFYIGIKGMNEISLALSGGAARGAYHLGILQFLDEQNIKVKAISATSIGAIIGASYASGVSPKEQMEIFKSKEFKDIFSLNLFKGSLLKANYKSKIIQRLLPVKNLEELNIPLHVTAVDIQSGEYLYFNSGNTKQICLASSALIPIFPSVEYDGKRLVDGGIINHMPTEPLKQYPYKIVGVNLHPIYAKNVNNTLLSNLKRAIFLRTYKRDRASKNLCDFYISSPKLENYSLFSLKYLDEMFEMGYEDASNMLKS